jgi:hypothetical protein
MQKSYPALFQSLLIFLLILAGGVGQGKQLWQFDTKG